MEIRRSSEAETAITSQKEVVEVQKRKKKLPSNIHDQTEVEFNEVGIPIGPGSVCLSSFLGLFVWEKVLYTLDDWRNLNDGLKVDL